jgi:hypothetical protein
VTAVLAKVANGFEQPDHAFLNKVVVLGALEKEPPRPKTHQPIIAPDDCSKGFGISGFGKEDEC